MINKWLNYMKYILPIAFLISAGWFYISLINQSEEIIQEELVLEYIPDYRITSRKALKVWPGGTVFDQGMASYFYAARPEITIIPRIKLHGPLQGELKGRIESQVVIQATNDQKKLYWIYPVKEIKPKEFTLYQEELIEGSPIEYTADNISIDIYRNYEFLNEIREELMFRSGVIQIVVSSQIDIIGEMNGISIDKMIDHKIPIDMEDISFSIPRTQEMTSSISLYPMNSQSKLTLWERLEGQLLPLLTTLFLGILSLYFVIFGKGPKPVTEHKRYREWITEGNVELKEGFHINILSLEGLVDLAIDLDKRVIFDSYRNKYFVLAEDIVYLYDPDGIKSFNKRKQQLGKLLLERRLLQPEQLEIGLYYQKKIGNRLGESLIALGFIDETTLYSTLAAQQKLDYYELDPTIKITDLSWLDTLSIGQARALMAFPLGIRADGKMVIVSSETGREGLFETLQEIFGQELHLAATRPTVIHKLLERIDRENRKRLSSGDTQMILDAAPEERLNHEELKQFTESYYRGKINEDLLLKAAGLIEPIGEINNLIIGLDKLIGELDWKSRYEKIMPTLIELLQYSNYLTVESVEWSKREQDLQGIDMKELLRNNWLVSERTIQHAEFLLQTLESILFQGFQSV